MPQRHLPEVQNVDAQLNDMLASCEHRVLDRLAWPSPCIVVARERTARHDRTVPLPRHWVKAGPWVGLSCGALLNVLIVTGCGGETPGSQPAQDGESCDPYSCDCGLSEVSQGGPNDPSTC